MNVKQVFKELDEFISYYKKARGEPPPLIRLNPEQHRLLKKWADERKAVYQETVVLNDKGNVIKYNGVEVRH